MCGITGFFDPDGRSETYPVLIKQMLAWIKHRGPDEAGFFVDDQVALGITRLSIIDLTSGTQPISDESRRFWICYNGELYNYKEIRETLKSKGIHFNTASDTEVVLKSWIYWKEKSLLQFNGAFAFIIYDAQEGFLFMARDRYGKRPLYYSHHNGVFLFSSEMKSFFGYDGFRFETDPHQLASIFAVWTPLPGQSGFKNIKQIPMGSYMIVNRSGSQLKRYTELDFRCNAFEGNEMEAAGAVRDSLAKSVSLRLRSDVEVGIYLSGGLDSTIVTDLVTREVNMPVHTFSVEFEEAAFDESVDQKLVSQRYGANHTSVRITDRDIPDALPAALFHAEVPVFRTAFVPMFLLSKTVRDAGIKVVLSGEGADEAFLGYDIFKETLLRLAWNELDMETRKSKLAQLYPYLDHFNTENAPHLMGIFQKYAIETMPGLFSHEMRFQNGIFTSRLLKEKNDAFADIHHLIQDEAYYPALSPTEKAQWLEFKTLLAGYLLSTQGDRMCLAHGVENRCPFLDPDVVALSHAVNLKFDDGFEEKYLLKKAFQDRLPQQILAKAKHPYRAPDISSFYRYRPDYLEVMLSVHELEKMEFFNPKFCTGLTQKVLSTDPDIISIKENHAFIFLLSCALLHHAFIERKDLPAVSPADLDPILTKIVDQRRRVS